MDASDIGILIALTSIVLAVTMFGFGVIVAILLAPRENGIAQTDRRRRDDSTVIDLELRIVVEILAGEEAGVTSIAIERLCDEAMTR